MTTNGEKEIQVSNSQDIRSLIYTVRGQQVMLDSDLARLYEVETGVLNRAAKRNEARFPDDFRFQVTSTELEDLRCQIGIFAGHSGKANIGRTYLPYVYTEQGIAMLSGVLRSEVAVNASIDIMRAFVEMRRFFAANGGLLQRMDVIERRQLEYQRHTDKRFEEVFGYLEEHSTREEPHQVIFFDGQIYDAFELLIDLVGKAEESLVLVDGYVDVGTLNILAKKRPGVDVVVYTSKRGNKITLKDVETFNAQYPILEVKITDVFHDRFLILDGKYGYHIGASLKDAGKRCFAINRFEDTALVYALLGRLGEP